MKHVLFCSFKKCVYTSTIYCRPMSAMLIMLELIQKLCCKMKWSIDWLIMKLNPDSLIEYPSNIHHQMPDGQLQQQTQRHLCCVLTCSCPCRSTDSCGWHIAVGRPWQTWRCTEAIAAGRSMSEMSEVHLQPTQSHHPQILYVRAKNKILQNTSFFTELKNKEIINTGFPLFQEFEIQELSKDLSVTFQVRFHDKYLRIFTNVST